MNDSRLLFIAGPTASGKSSAALALAERCGAVIVNADSMQVYADLRIITARPSDQDLARAPHELYGFLDGATACSAGRWSRRAAETLGKLKRQGRPAILVGGSGLYFKALEDGLSPIPEIAPEWRAHAAERLEAMGASAFREEVIKHDPAMAHLPVGDTQRLMRAFEVWSATGKPLSYYQSLPRAPLLDEPVTKAVIAPPRETLYSACDRRAEEMFSAGGVDEVAALLARNLDPGLPVMRALGVREIGAYLAGSVTQDDALSALQQNTRHFAKRQGTWLRNQMGDWTRYQNGAALVEEIALSWLD